MEGRAVLLGLLGLVVASLANSVTAANRAYDRDESAKKDESFEKGDCFVRSKSFEKGGYFVTDGGFVRDKCFGQDKSSRNLYKTTDSSCTEVTCGREVCIVGDIEGVDTCYYWEDEDVKTDYTSLNVRGNNCTAGVKETSGQVLSVVGVTYMN